jgi:hypothetical protein
VPCFGYGRGGIAYTLLRAGILRGDRTLVLSAQRWAIAGLRSGRRSRTRDWPRTAYSRGLTGLHAIGALAAHAVGDAAGCRREVQRFVATARRGRGSVELFQGMAGRLAGAAIVMRAIPDPSVRALGDELAAKVLGALERRAVELKPQGMAHGWEGVVLGALAWQAVARSLPEDALRRAVRAMHPYDVSWMNERWRAEWAHGHAGMALLFARAYALLGDPEFLIWAREAAEQARTLPPRGTLLLDGPAGIAYCMLAVAAVDPGGPWREAAWMAAAHSFSRVVLPEQAAFGVWSGLGGVCCLALDLVHETEAGFPGIEA